MGFFFKNYFERFTVEFRLFQDPSSFVHQHLTPFVGIDIKSYVDLTTLHHESAKPPKPRKIASFSCDSFSSSSFPPPAPYAAAPKPSLKSALKRPKPAESIPEETLPEKKRLMFKTTMDALEQRVKEAAEDSITYKDSCEI
ncbi:hypothetical protein DVH24_040823 [Malus domestica]|uniref:Uncharacterized protein n=1 Tax=Malus domestica TaxID=3750 RepID=A0A498I8A9_MALDO|nr:hypothetical protein DVH24_040823 [Malus domestica]